MTEAILRGSGALATAASRLGARAAAVRPAVVLAPLVAAHVAVVAALGLTAGRDGWLFATAPQDLGQWKAAWALAHLDVGASAGSYGLAVLLWPFALASGGALASVLPVLVPLQVLLGGSALVLLTFGIAARIGGRLVGYAAALGWVLAPLAALGFFYPGQRVFQGIRYDDYRGLFHDTALPAALGLNVSAAYPTMVALAAAAWLVVRALDGGDGNDVLLAGLVTGVAIGTEPAALLFVPAPLLALALARRPRHALAFAVALLPALATLALWRWSGPGDVLGGVDFSRETFRIVRIHLRGAGWSLLLVEWIAVAGAFALVRKAPAKGALVVAWLAAFFVLRAGSRQAYVLDASIYRLLEPGYPAFVLLAAALALLVPPFGRGERRPAPPERPPRPTRGLLAAAALLAAYPLLLVAAAAPGG